MSKRAVLYARVSYDDRDTDGRNLQSQLDMGRERCAEKGYRIVAELPEDDRGASGADFDLPQLNKALEMARAGEFEVLIVRELDRFARGLAKQLIVEGEFKRAGIEVEYVLGEYPDTPEGNLNKNIKAVIAEYERLKISERMVRGRRQKVKAGNVLVSQRPPYGYRVTEKDGKTTLEIHETEAAIVRLIFTWYTKGDGERGPMGLSTIASRLTKMHVPTFTDTGTRKPGLPKLRGYGDWGRGAVHGILTNEVYAGIWRYGKKNGHLKNPDDHVLTVSVPAVIFRETWGAAQSQREANRLNYRNEPKYDYLLRRQLTCGTCGAKMKTLGSKRKTKVTLYYRCSTRNNRDYNRSCNAPTFRADRVDAVVWDWVKEMLFDPDRLAQGLENYQAEQDKANEPLRARLAVVASLIADNREQLERLLDLYLSGSFPKEMLIQRKTQLETTIEALEREQAGLLAQLETRTLTDDQIQSLQEFAAKTRVGIELADFQTRRGIIEALDVQVTLVVENGEKIAYVQCVLPGRERVCLLSDSTNASGCQRFK
jgi:site-specific DNA recombinase